MVVAFVQVQFHWHSCVDDLPLQRDRKFHRYILISGAADLSILWIVLLLCVPYLITTLIGKALFDPKLERIYRLAAYSVILIAVISGLPLLD